MKRPKLISKILYQTSFRQKLLFTYTVIVLVPLILLSTYYYITIQNFNVTMAARNYEESLGQIADNISYKIDRYLNTVSYFLSSTSIARALQNTGGNAWERYKNYTEIIDPMFANVLGMNSDIFGITIYQNNPNLVDRVPSILSLSALKTYPWLDEVISSNNPCWQVEGKYISYYARLMSTYTDAPIDILKITIPANRVFNVTFDSIQEYALSVTRSDHSALWFESSLRSNISNENAKEFLKTNGEHISRWNERFMVFSSPIARTDWHVSLMMPVSLLYVNSDGLLKAIVLIILLCLALIFPLIILFSVHMVTRISKLNDVMIQVGNGNLNASITSPYQDEIGSLMNRFDATVASLRRSTQELYMSKFKQQEAEMRALRAQINPHFLYNTLSLINWKSIQAGTSEISEIVDILSTFYRTALNRGKNESLLNEEIMNIISYVNIQKMMHNFSFEAEYDIPKELGDCQVPTFVLQPLVENAIEHGIDRVRNLRGRLKVTAVRDCDNRLVISIYDNGAGFSPPELAMALSEKEHNYGLKNVDYRIRFAYGEAYGIRLGQPLDGYKTCVQLVMPYLESCKAKTK